MELAQVRIGAEDVGEGYNFPLFRPGNLQEPVGGLVNTRKSEGNPFRKEGNVCHQAFM